MATRNRNSKPARVYEAESAIARQPSPAVAGEAPRRTAMTSDSHMDPEPGVLHFGNSRLHSALQEQDHIIHKIEAALKDVLLPAPEANSGSEEPDASTTIGRELQSRARHVEGNNRWLTQLLVRISI